MKRHRVRIEFRGLGQKYSDGIIIRVPKFSHFLFSDYILYKESIWSTRIVSYSSDITCRKDVREAISKICKDINQRVLYLRHPCKVLSKFARLMIKHYGTETVMV